MAQTKKTDNDYLADKVALRAQHLPDGDVRVLDCFAGKGIVWECVRRLTGRTISTLAIDKRDDLDSFHLHGDNSDFLATMDLSRFNVIDLDAYGTPYEQIRLLIQREYAGTVFVTFIASSRGGVERQAMREIGFPDSAAEYAPSVLARRSRQYFLEWLALHGVERIVHRSKDCTGFRKCYGVFWLTGRERTVQLPVQQPAAFAI